MAVILKAERAILGSAQSLLSRQEGPIMTTDNSGLVIGVVFACLVFIALTIAVRLLVRKMMPHHRLYLDDGLVLVASLLVLSLCMVALEGTKHGLGQHERNLYNKEAEVEHTIMLMWVGQILYTFAISFAKFSIIASYVRILPDKRFHQACWVVLGVTVAFLVASVIASILICRPIQAAWDPTLRKPMSCYHFVDLVYASGVVNLVTDVVLCTLPLPYFLKLNIPRKQKISASCLFIAGGLAAIASAMRLVRAKEIANDGADITYTVAETLIWSVLECSISIITISIPPMRPLFAKFAPSIFNVTTIADDPKSLMGRISQYVGRPVSMIQRIPSRSSWSSKTSLKGKDFVKKRLSTSTSATVESSEVAWVPRETVIAEETVVEEKV